MKLNDVEKRWLEINFYLMCRYIQQYSSDYKDIENFFKGFRWTNLYDYDTIIKTLDTTNITINPEYYPSKKEFLVCLDQPSKKCRFQYTLEALKLLAKPAGYSFSAQSVFRNRMREEVATTKITLFPKIKIKHFHEAYFSFLLTLQHLGNLLTKNIRL